MIKMKKSKTLILLLLLSFSTFPLFASKVSSQETSVQFSPLQDIINNAREGSVIKIEPGVYYGLFKVNKSLTLKGTNVVIDANYSQVGIIVSAQSVRLEGFTVTNVVRFGNGSIPDEIREVQHFPEMEGAGIYVYFAGAVVISHVIVERAYAGIAFAYTSCAEVRYCNISHTTWGVMIYRGASIWISNSLITSNYDLENNSGGGIFLGHYTSDNIIRNSTISNNLWAIVSSPTPHGNQVHFNNFINNTHQIYIHPDAEVVANWDFNYWSDYNGTDLNLDDIGDTPYIINSRESDNHPLMKDPPLNLIESNSISYGGRLGLSFVPTTE